MKAMNTHMIEKNLRLCKICELLRIRINDGRFPNGKNKRFRDEQGNLWSGNVCGECNKKRIAEAMARKRKGE